MQKKKPNVVNARSNQGIQYAKSYMTYHERKRTTKPEVYWIYGKTGTFKSTLAEQFACDPHYQQESGKRTETSKRNVRCYTRSDKSTNAKNNILLGNETS